MVASRIQEATKKFHNAGTSLGATSALYTNKASYGTATTVSSIVTNLSWFRISYSLPDRL